MKRAAGYSLMELVVTMVIAGILAALAIPYFSRSEMDATWFYEQVKAAVRYAQRQAVAQRHPVFVNVSPAALQLCYDAGCAAPVLNAASGAAYGLAAPSDVSLSATIASFSFNGLGQPSPINGVSITVGGRTIVVTRETGYVQ